MLEQVKYGSPENEGPIKELFKNAHKDFEFACRNGFAAGFGNYILNRVIITNEHRASLGVSQFDARQVNDFIFGN